MSGFFEELKRRSVLRIAGLYLAGAWLLLQIAGTVLPMLDAPGWIARTMLLALLIGFLPVLVLTWAFEWTPKGLVREADAPRDPATDVRSGKRLDRWIMVVLALALGYFALDKFVFAPYRHAAQVQAAREQGRGEAVVAAFGDRSIAVLPFRDLSQAQDQKYFSEGVAEQVLGLLARIPGLRVISRTSAFSFAGKELDIPTIARKLNVGHVLEGSVRRAGDRVRVSVQLIEARSDTQLWAEDYDRPMGDIFAIQDEIAAEVVERLKLELLGAPPKARETSPEALRLYLQSLASFRMHSPEGYQQSVDLARQALQIDPAYVDAWNMLAVAYLGQTGLSLIPQEAGYRLAREATQKALEIAPDSADAHTQLAEIELYEKGDQAAAARDLQHALRLEPANTYALGFAEVLAKSLGRQDIAAQVLEHMTARDPLNSNVHSQMCLAYFQTGRLDESIASCRTALALEPKRVISHSVISAALLRKGDLEQALAEARLEPFEPFRMFAETTAYHALGEHAKSDAMLAQTIAKYEKDAAYNIAYVEASRGNVDAAFGWLDKAVEYRDTALPMIASDPQFAPLYADPRWKAFLRRQGKAPEQLAKIEFKVDLPGAAPSR